MLTTRDDVRERVEALDSGTDDHLTKPFSLEDVLTQVRARLRRSQLSDGNRGDGAHRGNQR